MLSQHNSTWQLGVACLVIGLGGCASTGSKLATGPTEIDTPLRSVSHTVALAKKDIAKGTAEPTADLVALEATPSKETTGELLRIDSIPEEVRPVQAAAIARVDSVPPGEIYPLDLANALSLGGADNLQVRIARTRLYQAQAKHLAAKALWLPSLRMGVGYNKHDGRLQATEGEVIEAGRNSLFYGAGLGLGDAPLAGGSGGPARLFVNLSLADAYFKPLSAHQEVAAQGAAARAATNDSLAQIAIGYHSLVEAHGLLANAKASQEQVRNMLDLVENFEREGFSSRTEVNRAKADLASRQRKVSDAQRRSVVRSAELARLLRLPAQVRLAPVEEFVLPMDYTEGPSDANPRIAEALQNRPEIAQAIASHQAACFRVKEEKWRPWIPNVQVGASAGGFGGGSSTEFPSAAGRSDVDLLAVWEVKNLGVGNVALHRQRRGELHERELDLEVLRDRIASEVVAASADVASYREQVELALQSIGAAKESYDLNEQRIRANEGLPIELLQSISALADARDAYTQAVANYHRSQHRLMRAMGNHAL